MNEEDKQSIKYYFCSGIMIAFGIAIVMASVIHTLILDSNPFYAFGIFAGGSAIGIGLLPFQIRVSQKKEKVNKE